MVILEIERESKRRVGRSGVIEITPKTTESVDGQTIYLSGSERFEGKDVKFRTVAIAVGVGWFFFPMLAYLAKRGRSAIVPANTVLSNIVVVSNYEVE